MHEEQQLIQRCKEGDQHAFQQIVECHERQVRATVIGLLGDQPEADDVAQEVFIRFFRALNQFKGESKLSTYLTRIAINLSLNEIKRRKTRQMRFQSLDQETHVFELEDTTANPVWSDEKENIEKAIQKLSPDFRTIVVLRLVEGHSVKETAEILKLPQGTVASRLARAQKKLRTLLGQFLMF